MRRLFLLLALAIASPAAGQLDIVHPPWRVYVASTDSTISTHNYFTVAVEVAANWSKDNPGMLALIDLTAPVRVSFVADCDCGPTEPPPDPGPDPTEPPVEPPDTTPPPIPPDTTPPVVLPGTIAAEWENLPVGSTHADPAWPPEFAGGGTAGGRGESRIAQLASPGPWGGTKALENYYGVVPANQQPQVGTEWHLPRGLSEVWLETWVRFGPEWEIGPDNPDYPGNVDHKMLFLWVRIAGQQYYPQRWECKVGVWWNTMPCSAASHDVYYQYQHNPATNAYSPTTRLDANVHAWDGQWHRVRWHAKMGAGDGEFEVWWDGVKTIDSGPLDTQSVGGEFASVQLGANRNQGTNHPQSFFFGPVYIHTVDPGW